MSSFSALFENASNPEILHQTMLDLVCLSIASDQQLTEEEYGTAVHFAAEMLGLNEDRAASLIDNTLDRIGAEGSEGVFKNAVQNLQTDEQKEAGFLSAAWVQYVDGDIAPEEDIFLARLADELKISPENSEEMLRYIEKEIASEKK